MVFSALDIIARIVAPSLINGAFDLVTALKSLLNGGQYWFLVALFMVFLLFPFLENLMLKHEIIPYLLIAILLIIRAYALLSFVPSVVQLQGAVGYLFYFIIGWQVRRKKSDMGNFLTKNFWIMIIAGIGWIASVGASLHLGRTWWIAILGAITGIVFFYSIAALAANKKCALLSDFSKYSLPLYVLNGYSLVVSRTLVVSVLGITNPLLIILLNMIGTLFIPWLIIKFVIDKMRIKFLLGM